METKISKQEFIDITESTMQVIFKDKHELAPILFICAGREIKIASADGLLRSNATKQMFVQSLQASMAILESAGLKPDYVAMVCEAYMVKRSEDDKEGAALAKELGAASMPDRVECATFYVWSKESTYTRMWEIDRSGAEPKLVESITNETPIAEEPTGINFRNPFKEV